MTDEEFFLKLRKLLDTYKPDWKTDDTFDGDNWIQLRVPYFFNQCPAQWDGYPFTRDLKCKCEEILKDVEI